jgi:nucleoside-diphosphate-sugar epimerase
MDKDNELVLVTGASGFIASHIIKLLQEEGYRVRGTVRSVKDEKKVSPLRSLAKNPKYPLELVEADLNEEKPWLDAVKDCTYVLHTASPVPNYVPRDENQLIKPAVNGTLFVLKACVQENTRVKRVVLTSSVAAVAGDEFTDGKTYTEKDFADPEKSQPYTKSKIMAEKAGKFLINK